MDIRQLHYFKEIVRQGSISKAAEVLDIAQPPLSQLLKKLETELSTTLIHRYRKKWEVTETGMLLYQYTEDILGQMREIKERIEEIEKGTAGTVTIGVSSSCSNMLIDYVSKFRAAYPHIKINIITGNSEEILRKLEQREMDLALLLRLRKTEQYKMKVLKRQPTAVIIPASWATSFSSEQVTFEQIAPYPFIMLGAMEGHSFTEDLLHAFGEQHLKPKIVIECMDISMVVALVSRGLGYSIIPRMNYASLFFENTTLYELKQFEYNVEPVFLRLKDERISKAATQFWEIVH